MNKIFQFSNFMNKHKFLAFLFVLISLFGVTSIWAAEIQIEKKINVTFRGEIKPGDAEQFASVIADRTLINKLSIDSPGGDLLEAMRIAELVKKLHITVEVAKGGHCVSACFFIFLEGHLKVFSSANDDGTLPTKNYPNQRGYVGIHRPYLKSPRGDVASTKLQEAVMRKIKIHLENKMISQSLIEEMMSRPSNDIYWLTARDAEKIGEYSPGDEEALISKCGYKRFNQSYNENWSGQRYAELDKCAYEYWEKNYSGEHMYILYKINKGWRPWINEVKK
jgi:hypothetical protein